MMSVMDVTFRFLEPDEGTVLTTAIEAAYGQSYDVRWVYDPAEVGARIDAGTYVSCIAESPAGELLCHIGMSLAAAGDAVGHSGQAVTLPAARGQHLFTRTKRHLMDWARERGLAGMYSEATAAHPYSQKANIELGAHETGFLLGWIPATVVERRRGRAPRPPVGGAALPEAERRARARRLRAGAAPGDRRPDGRALPAARTSSPTRRRTASCRSRTELHCEVDDDHNLALLTVHVPGADLEQAIAAERHHLFHRRCLDAVYIDLPLEQPATALVADHLERLGVSYAGVFPNPRTDGDVLRMQSLHRVRVKADDVAVASDHGRELLDYVLADLPQARLERRPRGRRGGFRPCA